MTSGLVLRGCPAPRILPPHCSLPNPLSADVSFLAWWLPQDFAPLPVGSKDTLSRVTSYMLNLIWCYVNCTWMLVEVNTEKKEGSDPPFVRISSYVRETQLIHLALLFIVPCDRSKYIDEKLLFIPPPHLFPVLYTIFFYLHRYIINHRWLKLSQSLLYGCVPLQFFSFSNKLCSWLTVYFLNEIYISDHYTFKMSLLW